MVVRLIIQFLPTNPDLVKQLSLFLRSIRKLHNFGYVIFICLLQSLGKYGTILVAIIYT